MINWPNLDGHFAMKKTVAYVIYSDDQIDVRSITTFYPPEIEIEIENHLMSHPQP